MEVEVDELRNQIAHLERSQRELKTAIAEGAAAGEDTREFKEAVSENIVTLAKQKARLAALEEELRRARGGGVDTQLEPPPPSPPPSQGGGGVWL